MTPLPASGKITASHLARTAIVYVRQSTWFQVQHNTASTARQLGMAGQAQTYGWGRDKIIVIDKDQGLSGASTEKREGFKEMVTQTISGRVGAIFALEASRLARDDFDWQQLVRLCAHTDTLIADESGIYVAKDLNDKLLLDFKGIFAAVEQQILKSRLVGGKLKRAEQGKLRFLLPPGYTHDKEGAIVIDPDDNVQKYVRLFFEQFKELGSAEAVARHFRAHKLGFPTRACHPEYKMMPLTAGRAVKLARNPTYAGIYVYGRRQTIHGAVLEGDRVIPTTKFVEVSPEAWTVVIPGSHYAYITEEQYRQNLLRLEANRLKKNSEGCGPARAGAALLQGIVRCGVCGNKMSVTYQGRKNAPTYGCFGADRPERKRRCTIASAVRVDPAVTECLLQALVPARAEESFGALGRIEADARRHIELGEARVKEAGREAAKAERLYLGVAGENSHVKAALERKWEEASMEVESARRDLEALRASSRQGLESEERESLLRLMGELPKLWDSPATDHQQRKELLRVVIKDVLLIRGRGVVKITVRWHGGGSQQLEVAWPHFPQSNTTDPATIELIRRLALTHTDTQIAEHLNREGIKPLRAERFDRRVVFRLRTDKGIRGCNSANYTGFSGQREDGRYSARAVARMLKVTKGTIIRWCQEGRLDAVRASVDSRFWIRIAAREIPKLKQSVRRVQLRQTAASS
jgi:DNA invertase Pin-like site-specific DNA recombinase